MKMKEKTIVILIFSSMLEYIYSQHSTDPNNGEKKWLL